MKIKAEYTRGMYNKTAEIDLNESSLAGSEIDAMTSYMFYLMHEIGYGQLHIERALHKAMYGESEDSDD